MTLQEKKILLSALANLEAGIMAGQGAGVFKSLFEARGYLSALEVLNKHLEGLKVEETPATTEKATNGIAEKAK